MSRLRGCSCSYSDGIIDEIEDIMSDISTADVIEREKIDKAIEVISNIEQLAQYTCGDIKRMCVEILKRNIGEVEE